MTRIISLLSVTLMAICALYASDCRAAELTADQILQKMIKDHFSGGFRMSMQIHTKKPKGKTVKHIIWVTGRAKDNTGDFFLEFESPEESKGLRFLFNIGKDKKIDAYMYLPATDKTLRLSTADPDTDIGGTGLTAQDMQSLAPQGNVTAELVKSEKVDGKDCYVIRTKRSDSEVRTNTMWVDKNNFVVIKSVQADESGKTLRIFKVTEFFKTKDGKLFPRTEVITSPAKKFSIKLVQENAVFGINVPEELLSPKTFGTFKWRL